MVTFGAEFFCSHFFSQRQKSQGTPAFAQSHKRSIGSLDDSIIFADFTKIELFTT